MKRFLWLTLWLLVWIATFWLMENVFGIQSFMGYAFTGGVLGVICSNVLDVL